MKLPGKWKNKILKVLAISLFIILLFVLVNSVYVWFSSDHSTQISETTNSIKLMTYNIFSYDINSVWTVVEAAQADIYVFQEVDATYENGTLINAPSWISSKLEYHLFNNDYASSYDGVTIVSRWPILETDVIPLPHQPENFPRSLLIALIATPYGNLTVLATHLQQPLYVKDQLDQIASIVDETNEINDLVLLCDCNTPDLISHKPYRELVKHFEDAWIVSGKSPLSGRTWPSDGPLLRVDYVWIKGSINVIEDSGKLYGDETNSDHLGLSVNVSLRE